MQATPGESSAEITQEFAEAQLQLDPQGLWSGVTPKSRRDTEADGKASRQAQFHIFSLRGKIKPPDHMKWDSDSPSWSSQQLPHGEHLYAWGRGKDVYGSKGSGQCKKRKEVYSRTALSDIGSYWRDRAIEYSRLNWCKLTCSVGIEHTWYFEDSNQKQEFKISLIITFCTCWNTTHYFGYTELYIKCIIKINVISLYLV